MTTKIKHSIKPAVYVIFRKDNDLLLALRQNTGYCDGQYSLVSGHVEKGESVYDAAIRETKEEAGVEIETKNLELVHTMFRIESEYIDFFFIAKAWQGDFVNTEPQKCAELKWFPINQLPANTIPFIKEAIGSYLNGTTFSEYREEE